MNSGPSERRAVARFGAGAASAGAVGEDRQVVQSIDGVENDEQVQIDAATNSVDSRFHAVTPCADPGDMNKLNVMNSNNSLV